MKLGFIIDNRKCIGCHACTTACKSEHEVPLGVFRTWVKQVEKGEFPNTRRLFSVMRCNHCTDAPCVEICPVTALYIRPDGIVDFDKRRCIGCRSCMQACPYDALYIDPDTHTAAKCNYCAHRVDIGLEPACVVVCPEHAIVAGDMHNPGSEISQLLAREQTSTRKPEKATQPNLFYIDGDEYSLRPGAASASPDGNLWSAQTRGVGHYAKYTEQMAWFGNDLVQELLEKSGQTEGPQRSIEVLTGKSARRVYAAPDKGVLWGWEVPAYVTTKALAAGAFLLPVIGSLLQPGFWINNLFIGALAGLVFLIATTALLVKDLDQPLRFAYVILRPQWRSWLVRGGYALSIYGALLTALLLLYQFAGARLFNALAPWVAYGAAAVAVVVAVYTAFLFAQARGRDFWQSPLLPLHMLVHTFMAGGALFLLLDALIWSRTGHFSAEILLVSIAVNLLLLLAELSVSHPTADAKAVVSMITKGRYRNMFFWGAVGIGNVLPAICLLLPAYNLWLGAAAGALSIAGIYITEKIWVEAPQRIPLS